jgi:hypothetical protein
VRVASNTVYAQMHARAGAFAVRLHESAPGNVLITITITNNAVNAKKHVAP